MDKKRIVTLFLIVLMDTAGAATIVPLIPVYVLAQFHATPFQAALLGLLALLAPALLVAPLLGAALASGVTRLRTLLWLREPLHGADGKAMGAPGGAVPLAQVLRRLPVLLVLARALLIGSYMAV